MKRRIVIVEDEFPVLMDLTQKVKKLGYDVVGAHTSYEDAFITIIEEHPDLVLLDINLGGSRNGIDLALKIKDRFDLPYLFITASSDESTFRAASLVKPMGFILKPFKLEDLRNNIALALLNYESKHDESEARFSDHENEEMLFVRNNGVYTRVNVGDILHIEAMDNYVKIFAATGKFTLNTPLKKIASKLPNGRFIRIHKSYLVALNQIKSIEGNSVFLQNGDVFPIGKTYKEGLMKSIKLL